MIDYDKTIDEFFKSVIHFLSLRMKKAKDKDELSAIADNINRISNIVNNLDSYSDYSLRVQHNIEPTTAGFIAVGSNNNSIYLAFSRVLYIIGEMHKNKAHGLTYMVDENKKELLAAIKQFNYAKSTNFFKDFVYPFKSPNSFAVRVEQNQR